ncbi:MAG TPA: hypothetical protein VFZ89_02300 [Solirubrobacteraceae bacterium]
MNRRAFFGATAAVVLHQATSAHAASLLGPGLGLGAPPAVVGIGVADLAGAKKAMTAATGVTWLPDIETGFPARFAGEPEAVELRGTVALSAAGPPLYALEEATPSLPPFDATPDDSPVRFAYFVPNVAAASADLIANGWRLIMTVEDGQPAGTASGVAVHEGPGGLLIEIAEPQRLATQLLLQPPALRQQR